jgi:hypothetical protein
MIGASSVIANTLNNLCSSGMHVCVYNARHIDREARLLFPGG